MPNLDELKKEIENLPRDQLSELMQFITNIPKFDPEAVRAVYKEYGDRVRHFSTVRSTLTTFLITVSLTAFGAYFKEAQHLFLKAAGFIFLFAAVVECLIFSYRTEKALIGFKKYRELLDSGKPVVKKPDCENPDWYKAIPKNNPCSNQIWGRMVKDLMNWLLMVVVVLIILAFFKWAPTQATGTSQAEKSKAESARLVKDFCDLKAKQTERGVVLTLGDVLFTTGKDELSAQSRRGMEKLVDFLACHHGRNVLIEGHTDSVGSDSSNFALSERRAHAVKTVLMERGINGLRVATKGHGKNNPVATNTTAYGRQLNRRVEVIVLNEAVNPEGSVSH